MSATTTVLSHIPITMLGPVLKQFPDLSDRKSVV